MEDTLWALWLPLHVLMDSIYLDLNLVHAEQLEGLVTLQHVVMK